MSSTATQAQEAHQPAAAEASHKPKRKREEAAEHADAKVVKRMYDLDRDILDCPICMKPFSPPVFQCQNGHTACSVCCKKLVGRGCPSCTLPTGSIRCITIEKLVESLLMSCKYARHGCAQVMRRLSGMEIHERYCMYEPIRCPVPECDYEATRDPLLRHLTEGHHISTVVLNNRISGVTFRMGPSNRFVMVSVDVEKTHIIYLVHREVHKNMGNIFFCTYFGSSDIEKFNLRVEHRGHTVPHIMERAQAIHFRYFKEYLKDFLVVPAKYFHDHSFEVNFKVTDDDDE